MYIIVIYFIVATLIKYEFDDFVKQARHEREMEYAEKRNMMIDKLTSLSRCLRIRSITRVGTMISLIFVGQNWRFYRLIKNSNSKRVKMEEDSRHQKEIEDTVLHHEDIIRYLKDKLYEFEKRNHPDNNF